MIEKHSQTKYFILDPAVAIAPALTTTLYNPTTTTPILPVNAGVFYKPVAGSGNHNEIAGAPGSAMQFIYRRNTAGDKSPLYSRPFEQSDWINASCINGIIIDQRNAAFGSNDSHLIGTTATSIVPNDLTTYQIQVSGHGDRTDWYNGSYNTPTTFGFYTSPDFSAGTLTAVQQLDTIVAELALDFNNKSRDMSFVVAIESAGTAVGTGATLISSLGDGTVPVGTTVTLGYDISGSAHSFVLTREMAVSFAALDARLTVLGFATAKLVPYLTSGTSILPAGVVVAGTTNTADLMYVMALNEGLGYYDYRVNTKRRIEVGLVSGFDATPQERISVGSEGSGYGHQLEIEYRKHNRFEEHHASRMPHQSYHVEFPNAFKADALYDYFVIEHCDNRTATSGMPSVNMNTTIIAVVNTTLGDATSNPYFGVANAAAQRAYLVTSINRFNLANSLNATVSGAPLA
jgi:hypothetical protein